MKQNKPKRKGAAVDFFGRALEVPSSALGSDGKTEIIGNREATVDGCRCVVEYGSDKITLNIGRGNISFFGSDLEIASLQGWVAVIKGIIVRVEFSL